MVVKNDTTKELQEILTALEGLKKEDRNIVKVFILGLQAKTTKEEGEQEK